MWSVAEGQLQTLKEDNRMHRGAVRIIQWSPKGTRLISADEVTCLVSIVTQKACILASLGLRGVYDPQLTLCTLVRPVFLECGGLTPRAILASSTDSHKPCIRLNVSAEEKMPAKNDKVSHEIRSTHASRGRQ